MRQRRIAKNELRNLKVQERKKNNKKQVDYFWITKIIVITFLISFTFSFLSEMALSNVNISIGLFLVFLFITIGIVFDMIGVAVTSADIEPFNSMSSRKIRGAKIAVKLIKSADKVSSFCNDVIGDICGIISGSAGSIISLSLTNIFNIDKFFMMLLVTAFIASLTIGGKAFGKSYAINQGNIILYKFSKALSYFIKE